MNERPPKAINNNWHLQFFNLFEQIIAQALKVSPGTVKSCVETLNNGNLLAISPGNLV